MESHDHSSSGHTVYTHIDCLFPGGSGVPSNIESGGDRNIKGSWAAKQTICILYIGCIKFNPDDSINSSHQPF